MPASDPWLWTVDDLVAEVCHSDELYRATGHSPIQTPHATTLEQCLRSRQLTGKTFLALGDSELGVRNELNVPRQIQQAALHSIVHLLRQRSYLYKQRTTTARLGSLGLDSVDYSPSVRLTGTSKDVTVPSHAGSKRRKITHFSTAPLHNAPPKPQVPLNPAPTKASQPALSNSDDYGYLLKWQNVIGGDQIVDLPDEDDLEEEDTFGLGDTAEEDLQICEDPSDDAVEEQTKRTKLSQDDMVEIINERIEFYTNAWVPNKGTVRGDEVDYDPETMWDEAEAKGEREALAQKYEMHHEYFSQRLNRLCDEIIKFPGSNAEQVRRQCSNLEVTVNSMELAAWLRDIYKLDPVNHGEQEHILDDQSRIQQNMSAHRVEPANEIINLGSPSGSSDIEDGNASPFDNETGAAADTDYAQFNDRTRSSTRDSVIADSVEPVVYAHPGLFELDGNVSSRTPVNHGDEPENASIATVRRWEWEDLVEHVDRKRVVSKTIQELKFDDREVIRSRIRLIGKSSLIKEMRACIDMLCKGDTKLQGVLPRDMPKILTFTKLFLSWWFCSNYSKGPEASKRDLEELKECMDSGVAEATTFYDYLYTIMGTTFSEEALQNPDQPSQAEIIEISDDD